MTSCYCSDKLARLLGFTGPPLGDIGPQRLGSRVQKIRKYQNSLSKEKEPRRLLAAAIRWGNGLPFLEKLLQDKKGRYFTTLHDFCRDRYQAPHYVPLHFLVLIGLKNAGLTRENLETTSRILLKLHELDHPMGGLCPVFDDNTTERKMGFLEYANAVLRFEDNAGVDGIQEFQSDLVRMMMMQTGRKGRNVG